MAKWLCLLFTTALSAEVQGDTCLVYVCDEHDLQWAEGICGQAVPRNSSAYALNPDACSAHEICDFRLTPATCQTAYNYTKDAYPGEPCTPLNNCLGDIPCTEGICATNKTLGDACVEVFDCGLGMTCRDTVCVALMGLGDVCERDTDCPLSMGCDIGPGDGLGRCIKYLSLSQNQSVASCNVTKGQAPVFNPFCKSTLCSFSTAINYPVCAPTLSNYSPVPRLCSGPNYTCDSSVDEATDTVINRECACGYNGWYYCQLFPGDKPMQDYIENVQHFLNSKEVSLCNTIRHTSTFYTYLGNPCVNATSKATSAMKYSYLLANFYPQVVKAGTCVLRMMNPGLVDNAEWYSLAHIAAVWILW